MTYNDKSIKKCIFANSFDICRRWFYILHNYFFMKFHHKKKKYDLFMIILSNSSRLWLCTVEYGYLFIYFFLWWEVHKKGIDNTLFFIYRQVNKALRYILVDSIFFVECYVMWHFLNRHLREVTPHISFIFLNFKNQTHFNHSVVFLIMCTKNQFILYVL